MKLNKIDMNLWKRKSQFDHFYNDIRCVITVTAEIEITSLIRHVKANNLKFYPVFTYIVSKVVNNRDEFRYGFDNEGAIGIYEISHPSYIIFHKDDETTSQAWSTYDGDFEMFYNRMSQDMAEYDKMRGFNIVKLPYNIFNVSCVPWLNYTALDLHIFDEAKWLAPIITWGKFSENGGKYTMPLTLQIHHAVADGFHTARFFKDTEKTASELFV